MPPTTAARWTITSGLATRNIREGLQDKLYLGNINAKRDWGFARDYVEAMWLMLQHPVGDDYVVATGEMYSVRDFMELAFAELKLDWQKHFAVDERYYRPCEVELLLGDSTKAHEQLGWKPRTSFKELVRMMVQHDWQLAKQEKLISRRAAA